MPIRPRAGCAVLREVVAALEQAELKYWIGRGVFRQWTLRRSFGSLQGDIDFHILREHQHDLLKVVEDLQRKGYQRISALDQRHKVTVRKGNVEVEFAFLKRDGGHLWHQAGWPEKRRYDCPATAFKDRRVKMFGVSVRVPATQYLSAVFGPHWCKNKKGSGGRPLS